MLCATAADSTAGLQGGDRIRCCYDTFQYESVGRRVDRNILKLSPAMWHTVVGHEQFVVKAKPGIRLAVNSMHI